MKGSYQVSDLSFSGFVNSEDAKLSLILNAIDPLCGGVIIIGEKGCGKSTLIRLFKKIVDIPFFELPLNITEESLVGGIDVEETIKKGKKVFKKGILGKAHKGIVYVEDINLLPQEILSILFETQTRGLNIVQREGIQIVEKTEFVVIATMNPEEGDLSYHFLDRFGLCAYVRTIKDKEERKKIIKSVLFGKGFSEEEIKRRIKEASVFKKDVKVPEDILSYMEDLLLKDGISSHRADISLFYASRAYAAYLGQSEVRKEHVDKVYPLVVSHRISRSFMKEEERVEEKEEKQGYEKREKGKGKSGEAKPKENKKTDKEMPGFSDVEKIFPVGETFKVKRLFFRKDRILRKAEGRRTKTRTEKRSGRYVRYILRDNGDIAIDATIRAAAPYQKRRGASSGIIIKDEDLRFRQREKRMSHLFLFVVDGSGSMAAKRRIVEAKGAIKSLLMDCYQRRDRVSMILFRKDRAEVVLPPTSSSEIALKKLKDLPTGGATPLSAGLFEAYKLIRQLVLKDREIRIVLFIITDGRANRTIKGEDPLEEVRNISYGISSFPQVETIVVDTEDSGILSMGMCKRLASFLNAKYIRIEDLKEEVYERKLT